MDVVCWENEFEDRSVAGLKTHRIPELDGVGYRLLETERCADWFPRDLVIPTDDPETPPKSYKPNLYNPYLGRGERMTDILANVFGWLVVSPRLRSLLEQELNPDDMEYLPITVKRAETLHPYFIARPLHAADCIDMEKTQGSMNALRKGSFLHITRLVLKPEKFPPGVRLFRASRSQRLVLIDAVLAQAMVDADHEGAFFSYVEDYGMEWRGRDG